MYYPYNRGALLASCVFLYAITAGAAFIACFLAADQTLFCSLARVSRAIETPEAQS